MCNYYVDFSETAKKFKTEVDKIKDIVGFNDEKFKEFVNLNFMKIKNDKIIISDSARLYIRNIAMEFDPLLKEKIGTYSKTI